MKPTKREFFEPWMAFAVIAALFLVLTLATSYRSLSILPIPGIFYFGSIGLGASLFFGSNCACNFLGSTTT